MKRVLPLLPLLLSPSAPFLLHSSRVNIPLFASPSRVTETEDDLPTLDDAAPDVDTVDVATLKGLKFDPDNHLPGQSWRRGDTDGCEDPISAEWRTEGEGLIRRACASVGAECHDVTWYMAQVAITLERESLERVEGEMMGPEVVIEDSSDFDENGNQDYNWGLDAKHANDEDLEDYVHREAPTEEEDVLETKYEHERNHPKVRFETVEELLLEGEVDEDAVDHEKIRAVVMAVNRYLDDKEVEKMYEIKSRHEIYYSYAPRDSQYLVTQKQFDGHRGEDVAVQTRDPWKSNRTLKGKLVGRDALDVTINIAGNMVVLPNNFVYRVKLN